MPAADLAALGQGAQTITASVNDRAGNPGQATHAPPSTVDTVAPTVTIATVAGDDIINNAEQLAGQTISGTTTAEVGQTVTVTFNGQTGAQRSAAAEAGRCLFRRSSLPD